MRVTIQYRKGRKTEYYTAFRATLLYADRKVILTRGMGAEQMFVWYEGTRTMMLGGGYLIKSSFGQSTRDTQKSGFRLAPSSVKAIKAKIESMGEVTHPRICSNCIPKLSSAEAR